MFGTLTIPGAALAQTVAADSIENLQRLSIGQLANLQVTTVSKMPESLREVHTAVSIVTITTRDDIVRSGARRISRHIPARPNLELLQTGPNNYVIAARGLSGNSAAQNFSNKIEVLIDGRRVDGPLYSGVYQALPYGAQMPECRCSTSISDFKRPSRHRAGGRRSAHAGQSALIDGFRQCRLRCRRSLCRHAPNPAVPAYDERDSRLAWRIVRTTEIGVSDMNLLEALHQEWSNRRAMESPARFPSNCNRALRAGSVA